MPYNKIKPLQAAVSDMDPRGFNMEEFSENSSGNNSEEFLIANAIREIRIRRLNMQMALKPPSCSEEESIECLFSSVLLDFIATKQHYSCVSLLSSVDQEHWMVVECLE